MQILESKETFEKLRIKNAEKIRYIRENFHSTHDTKEVWDKYIKSPTHLRLFYKLTLKALESCFEGNYHHFDAHTTANCCHGMAVYAKGLIFSLFDQDLHAFHNQVSENLTSLTKQSEIDPTLPHSLIELTSLYTLSFIGEIIPAQGRRTSSRKLKELEPVGTSFCTKLSRDLQRNLATHIALSYNKYANQLDPNLLIHNITLDSWKYYIKPDQLRKDSEGTLYAPCLFSMQILLHFLAQSKSKIALINDLNLKGGTLEKRIVKVLQGDGKKNFIPLTESEVRKIEAESNHEPIIVFAGCAFIENEDLETTSSIFHAILLKFSSLILSCDVYYPHFPSVNNDPNFDNSSIKFHCESISTLIENASMLNGVSAENPSLFFLTHIYPSSLKTIIKAQSDTLTLSNSADLFPYNLLSNSYLEEIPC